MERIPVSILDLGDSVDASVTVLYDSSTCLGHISCAHYMSDQQEIY
jgi:hypothetical protein